MEGEGIKVASVGDKKNKDKPRLSPLIKLIKDTELKFTMEKKFLVGKL